MNQEKTGQFIASLRKEQSLTQAQLAERLGITDRAVSKWERGKSLPDVALMPQLCEILHINVNELLSGERLGMEEYNRRLEENLLEMTRAKEESDKHLLKLEWVIGFTGSISFFVLIFVASFLTMPDWVRVLLIALGMVSFLVAMVFGLQIEQKAGYYECRKCGYRYVPSYRSVFLAMHVNRTRYMKCPQCHQRSWQKKVLSKENEKMLDK